MKLVLEARIIALHAVPPQVTLLVGPNPQELVVWIDPEDIPDLAVHLGKDCELILALSQESNLGEEAGPETGGLRLTDLDIQNKIVIDVDVEAFRDVIREADTAIAYWGSVVAFRDSDYVLFIDVVDIETTERHRVNGVAFQRALRLMMPKYATRLMRIVERHADRDDVDVAVQLACFGDVRYS